ncbi:hypothetical protein [Promicromonospora iranensis]|jgi:dienelactone hydrolase|uniref:hypothetical protein n=1 Tax=Promicromonospora iranensis TaxID=1105144 RepID=UPI0023A99F7C|nr:hypothetical protein [Promicromonospora iranensis]
MEARPQIVCLCGSTRFAEQFRAVNRDLTLAGAIVVAPAEFERATDRITDEQKAALGTLHLAKIDLADRIVVINPGGYIGESTRREIRYAHQTGKPVEYTDALDGVINP